MASEVELEASVESCEDWALASGSMLLLGVLGLVLSPIAPSALGPSLADGWLIGGYGLIFGGVAGALSFGRMSGRCQSELLRRSKDKLAAASNRLGHVEVEFGHAEERAAQAAERTAKLHAHAADAERHAQELGLKAAEALLKLQQLSNPRVPNAEKFLKALAGKPRPGKIDVLYSMDGADCATLAAWTAKLLRDAGWHVDPEYPVVIPRSLVTNVSATQQEGAQPWGITVLDPDPKKSGGAVNALMDALFESLGSPLLAAVKSEKIPKGSLRVVVGPRP